MKRIFFGTAMAMVLGVAAEAAPGGAIDINGDFRTDADRDGRPDGWFINGKGIRFLPPDQGGPGFRLDSLADSGVLVRRRFALAGGKRYQVRLHVVGQDRVYINVSLTGRGPDPKTQSSLQTVGTVGYVTEPTVLAADFGLPAGITEAELGWTAYHSRHPTMEYEWIRPRQDPHWILRRVELEEIASPPARLVCTAGLTRSDSSPAAPWLAVPVARWDLPLSISPATAFTALYHATPYPVAPVRCRLSVDAQETLEVPFDLSADRFVIVRDRTPAAWPMGGVQAKDIYFLWAASLLDDNIPGGQMNGFVDPTVAELVIVGRDGASESVPLRWYHDLCDRRLLDWPLATAARVWTDRRIDPKTQQTTETQGLWVYRWANPRPERPIQEVRLHSRYPQIRLYVHAMSVRLVGPAPALVAPAVALDAPTPLGVLDPPLTAFQRAVVEGSCRLEEQSVWQSDVAFCSRDPQRIRLANKLMALRPYVESGDYGWVVFPLWHVYRCFPQELTPQARRRLEDMIWDAAATRQARHMGFAAVKYNINHSLYGAMRLAVAAEVFHKPDWARDAEYAYDCLFDTLQRTGTVAEYNSPVYYEIDFNCLGLVELFTTDARLRLKNRLMQELLFWDMVARYHRPTTATGGPHARAYPLNTHELYAVPRFLMARQLGELPYPDWQAWTAPEKHWSIYTILPHARFPHTFPDYLRPLIVDRPYPWLARAYSRCGDWSVRYKPTYVKGPDAVNLLTTFQTPRYVVGSADRSHWGGGQNDLAIVHWVRRSPPQRVGDIGILFMRQLPLWQEMDYSWFRGLQHDRTVVGLYWPRGKGDPLEQVGVGACISDYGVRPERVWVGDQPVDQFEGQRPPLQPLWVSDRDTYVAVRPLRGGALREQDRVTLLENKAHRLSVWWRNFVDPAKPVLNDAQLETLRGGFLLHVGSREQDGSFEAFRARVAAFQIDETFQEGIWSVQVQRDQDRLVLRYDMRKEEVLEASVNGRPNKPDYLFQAPLMAKGNDGLVVVDHTRLEGQAGESLWLFADAARHHYGVMKTTEVSSSLKLTTPDGAVQIAGMSLGRVEVRAADEPQIRIDSLRAPEAVDLQGFRVPPRVVINGREQSPKPPAAR